MDIHALLKFGAREHMEQLVKEGALFMQPISYFIALEDNASRGDKHEALSEYRQGPGTRVIIDGKHELSHEKGTLKYLTARHEGELACNIFSAIAITSAYSQVDPENKTLGDACVVIYQPKVFLERFLAAAASVGSAEYGLVKYVAADYSGAMGPFTKFSEGFAHQNEYRVLVRPGSPAPLVLRLGSLEGIAELGPSATINAALAGSIGKRLAASPA
jgi:hypothetical protein